MAENHMGDNIYGAEPGGNRLPERWSMDATTGRFNEQEAVTRQYIRGEISPDVFFAWVRADSAASLSEDEARWVGRQRAKDLQDEETRPTLAGVWDSAVEECNRYGAIEGYVDEMKARNPYRGEG